MTDPIQVTQAARDAAAELVSLYGDGPDGLFEADCIRCGTADDAPEAQAFARFEQQIRLALASAPQAGEIGELVERLRPALGLLPITLHETPDYAECNGPDFQGMTMKPEAFAALNELPAVFDTILSLLAERDELREQLRQTVDTLAGVENDEAAALTREAKLREALIYLEETSDDEHVVRKARLALAADAPNPGDGE